MLAVASSEGTSSSKCERKKFNEGVVCLIRESDLFFTYKKSETKRNSSHRKENYVIIYCQYCICSSVQHKRRYFGKCHICHYKIYNFLFKIKYTVDQMFAIIEMFMFLKEVFYYCERKQNFQQPLCQFSVSRNSYEIILMWCKKKIFLAMLKTVFFPLNK